MGSGRSDSQPIAITVRNATKRYGAATILDDVSIAVEPGEFVTLLGPSGSGKTTLLNIIAGFTEPDSGQIAFGNDDVTRKAPHERGIGIVFQNYALFPHMSVAENVAFPLKARKLRRSEIADSVSWALSLVKLAGFGERRIDQLSGGQKQRVALARAIVFRPRLILMDEPLSALDKQLREHMQIEIRALHETLGATSIYVTHDQREALTLSHRIAILNKGRIAQYASPEDVYDRPADAFVADFIGEGTLVPVERAGPSTISLAGSLLTSPHVIPSTGELKLVIRSEKLRLAGSATDANTFPARVRSIVFQGDSYLILADTRHGVQMSVRLVTHADSVKAPRIGDEIALQLHPNHTYVVADPAS